MRNAAKEELTELRAQLHALQSQRQNLATEASMLEVQKQQQYKLLHLLQQVSVNTARPFAMHEACSGVTSSRLITLLPILTTLYIACSSTVHILRRDLFTPLSYSFPHSSPIPFPAVLL